MKGWFIILSGIYKMPNTKTKEEKKLQELLYILVSIVV